MNNQDKKGQKTMKIMKTALLTILAGLVFVGTAGAETSVDSNITESTTWTPEGGPYNLQDQIYVEPGASLTIEAGTVIASTPSANGSGSLAVCRGADIYVMGTKENPVIMTSTDDNRSSWREACCEWGNLTVMGDALISASHYDGNPVGPATDGDANNPVQPDGTAQKQMEGLTEANLAMYGGDNDNDDSGEIHYLSLRYGGRVVGQANELNGLSLGGIGRGTEIDHVEIMNNVDDGIEIWGGTVNLKYVAIWNIGDDSFDIDEGWRGKAQFGLIVQGYSQDADQGSGVGDNCFETDGAEDCYAKPVTTASIYNFTAIGQPDGDGATTWRDNARMQYNNCIFMNIGETLVKFDDDDGDGALGYSGDKSGARNNTPADGTLNWVQTWTTDYDYSHDPAQDVNRLPGDTTESLQARYQAQTSGKLAQITDSVTYGVSDYSETDLLKNTYGVDVFAAGNNNVKEPANMPIQSITREAPVTRGGKTMARVTNLNPCAANDATTSAGTAPSDGFFTPVQYRGAFSATNNWLEGWTAADEFGMIDTSMNADDPAADSDLPKVETQVEWDSENGVLYTVEKSSDMRNWTPVEVVEGDGTTMSVTDLDSFDATKFYRVIRQ